ncbi:MAG TPA: HAMP domain-containing sensor histidine kinase [Chryseolinea sp.]
MVQIKVFDQQMNAMTSLAVSINGKEFVTLEGKKATFHEISKEDLPPKFIKIDRPEWEAESWNYSRGTLEIIVRKKLYSIADIIVETGDRRPVPNAVVNFKGKTNINATTGLKGELQLPLALDEVITSSGQFSIAGYRVVKLSTAGKGGTLVVEALPKKEKPVIAVTPLALKDFDLNQLDSIRSLTVFYAVFKNYDMSGLDALTREKIDAKFYSLVGQLQQSGKQKVFIGKISDSSFVKNDVENLLAQAKYENTLLDNFRSDFDKKVRIINQKLAGGASTLKAAERKKLVDDLNLLEGVLEQNEDKFYKNISDYRIILSSLKSSFSDIQLLEEKLSFSEMKRREEQKAFRIKIFLTVSIAIVFGSLVVLLILLRARLEKQKKSLVKANDEVKRMNENLEFLVYERTELLIGAYQEMDIFLYRASHDLRAPLCTIIGLGNIAQQSPESTPELIGKISNTAVKMDGMLKKLRMMTEVNHPSNYSPVTLAKKIDTITGNFSRFIAEHDIEVIVDCREDTTFHSYPDLVEIILYNLIENALFFSSTCKDRRPRISIMGSLENDQVFISVYDNGIGMEEQIRVKLWDMFFVGNELSQGNGLGLYIVLKSVQSLNGKIDVQTEPGVYSRFSVTIPVNTNVTSPISRLGAPKSHRRMAEV